MVAQRRPDISQPFRWGNNPFRGWEAECLVEAGEYDGRALLRIACTQLAPPYTKADQKRIVAEWCDFFRQPRPIEELIVDSRTPVELFEAICHQRKLKRLRIKWGPVVDLTPIENLINLEALNLGTTGVKDLSPLAGLKKLKYLDLDNFKCVTDFSALSQVRSLEFLSIEGYPQGPQKIRIKNLNFVANLARLRALKIGFVIVNDYDVSPLLGLRKLEYLILPRLPNADRDRILAALPKLKYGNVQPGKEVRTEMF